MTGKARGEPQACMPHKSLRICEACRLGIEPMPIDRTLTVQNSLAVDELPNGHVLDPETPSGFGNAQSTIAGGETVAPDEIQETLAFFAVLFFGTQPGSKGSQLFPSVFKTRLGRLVPINEDRIGIRIMRQYAIWRLFIEPACRAFIVLSERNQRRTDKSRIATGEQIKKGGVNR